MSTGDEWYTPPEIIRSLGEFDLDPATCAVAHSLNHSAKCFYTAKDDGLLKSWNGRIWLNPPYSFPLIRNFLKKMAEHNNGTALVFAGAAKFLYDRTRFLRPDGTPGTQPRNGSMLLAFGK